MKQQIEELTLLLLYLTSWEEEMGSNLASRQAWKNHRFEVLDALEEAGYLSQSRKMIFLSPKGADQAELLMEEYLGKVATDDEC